MIITVTMNPAIDKTVDIEVMERGGLNRIERVEQDAGGKGINVSRTIRQLGGSSIATGFLAGNAGSMIEEALAGAGIQTDFIRVPGETRTNMKVVEKNGTVTELNEPGPEVSPEQVELLIRKLETYAASGMLIVLSGSIPKGVDRSVYREITQRMHAKGAAVLLDADGELFVNALDAGPDLVKPNRVELEGYFGKKETAGVQELLEMGEELQKKGAGFVAISMGGDGALFLQGKKRLKSAGLSVRAHSTVGAGDAMVAALAYGWEQGLSLEETAALAMAVSAGAVTTVGTKPPSGALVEELRSQVRLEKV